MYQLGYYIIFIPLFIYGGYYLVSAAFAFKKYKSFKVSKPKNKFGIIIPARNEAEVVGDLVDSLNKQNYPKDLFEIYVIPNNCSDNTAEVAEKHGAKILTFKEKISSKGDVLKLVFAHLNKNSDCDAYAIFDADNVVDSKFLEKMNDGLECGCQVMQGYRDTKNINDSWISASYALFYWGQNFLFGQSRYNLGSGSNLNGTGFVVKKSVLTNYGFQTYTLTEDIEFTAQCALNDINVVFAKDAITYDEQPNSFTTSWKQRKRWSTGTMECAYKYSGKLLKKAATTGDLFCLDMGLFFLAPFVQILGALLFIMLFAYNLLGIKLYDLSSYFYAFKEWFFILCFLFSILICTAIVIIAKKKIKLAIKGIIMFAFFMLTWIPINIVCLFKKTITWEEIKHNRKINIDSIE